MHYYVDLCIVVLWFPKFRKYVDIIDSVMSDSSYNRSLGNASIIINVYKYLSNVSNTIKIVGHVPSFLN